MNGYADFIACRNIFRSGCTDIMLLSYNARYWISTHEKERFAQYKTTFSIEDK
jgi:hypothetical protein